MTPSRLRAALSAVKLNGLDAGATLMLPASDCAALRRELLGEAADAETLAWLDSLGDQTVCIRNGQIALWGE